MNRRDFDKASETAWARFKFDQTDERYEEVVALLRQQLWEVEHG